MPRPKNQKKRSNEDDSSFYPASKSNRRKVQENIYELFSDNETSPIEKLIQPLKALTIAQGQYIAAQKTASIVFGIGSAGTGKSYVALALACEQLLNKEIEKIIVTRPMVETGAKIGALPGTMLEKYTPYMAPLLSILKERLGKTKMLYYLKHEKIQEIPLEFMRGMTFNDAVVILDEAQNSTIEQMKMFLTRIGKNCRFVINGDDQQSDIRGTSGLVDAVKRLQSIKNIITVSFTEEDIVRNELIKNILIAYRK